MTHLTRTTQESLFSTKVAARPNRETGDDAKLMSPSYGTQREAPFSVGVCMTPDEERALRMANYPAYEWPSVSNLTPRHRGKHY